MKRLAFIFSFVVTIAAACSPPNIATSNAAAACADFAYARCTRTHACSPIAIEVRYPNEATCESLLKNNCINMINAPSSGATAAYEEGCAQTISGTTWSCSDFLVNENPPPQCTPPVGSLPGGSACAFAAQCQTGFCSVQRGSACGVCAPPPQLGDACAQLISCGTSQFCNSAMQCDVFAPVGASCSPTQPCVPGAGCAAGTCAPITTAAKGDACPSTGPGCDFYQGLTCDGLTRMCIALPLATAGQACGYIGQQNIVCTSGGTCVNGVCIGAVGVGQTCDISAGPFCISPSRCVVESDGSTTGTCVTPDASLCP